MPGEKKKGKEKKIVGRTSVKARVMSSQEEYRHFEFLGRGDRTWRDQIDLKRDDEILIVRMVTSVDPEEELMVNPSILDAIEADGMASVVSREHGEHLPGADIMGWVVVLVRSGRAAAIRIDP